MIDVQRARRETPGCRNVRHFNNAGSSLMPEPVLEATVDYLHLEAQIGGYEAAARESESIERIYDAAAQLIHARPDEIAVIENATRAWDMAFYSIPFQAGDRILTARSEYASNFIPYLQIAQKAGVNVEVVPNDDYGQISLDALENMLDEDVKLISIVHMPTNGGLVNPVEKVGSLAREAGVLFLLDACQSVGQYPVDVQTIQCDMLSTTGRKYLRGPRGTGFLYVREEILEQLEPPFLDLHAARWVAPETYEIRSDARRFENWETYYAGKVGLGVAIDYALGWGIGDIWERIQHLANQLRSGLSDIPGITVRDLGEVQSGIVTFTTDNVIATRLKDDLSDHQFNVSVSRPSSTLLDMTDRNIAELVRASVHYYNSEDEIDQLLSAIESAV